MTTPPPVFSCCNFFIFTNCFQNLFRFTSDRSFFGFFIFPIFFTQQKSFLEMARPFPKMFELGGGIYCTPKLFPENSPNPRLVINICKFRRFQPQGKLYFREGIFLYFSQYKKMRRAIDGNDEFFDAVEDSPETMELIDINYGAFMQRDGMNGVKITVQSKSGPMSLRLSREQYMAMVKQSEKIQRQIDAFEGWIEEKVAAEEAAERHDNSQSNNEEVGSVQNFLASLVQSDQQSMEAPGTFNLGGSSIDWVVNEVASKKKTTK